MKIDKAVQEAINKVCQGLKNIPLIDRHGNIVCQSVTVKKLGSELLELGMTKDAKNRPIKPTATYFVHEDLPKVKRPYDFILRMFRQKGAQGLVEGQKKWMDLYAETIKIIQDKQALNKKD